MGLNISRKMHDPVEQLYSYTSKQLKEKWSRNIVDGLQNSLSYELPNFFLYSLEKHISEEEIAIAPVIESFLSHEWKKFTNELVYNYEKTFHNINGRQYFKVRFMRKEYYQKSFDFLSQVIHQPGITKIAPERLFEYIIDARDQRYYEVAANSLSKSAGRDGKIFVELLSFLEWSRREDFSFRFKLPGLKDEFYAFMYEPRTVPSGSQILEVS
jgi:hypothetical protein